MSDQRINQHLGAEGMIYIDKQDIVDILDQIHFVEEPKVPFPQADTFTRIICICEHLLNIKKKIKFFINFLIEADLYLN